ncbi:hypothetical protein V6Z11_A11G178800 [Gossypium hirsutum]
MVLSSLEEPFSLGISFDSISMKQREEIHGIFARLLQVCMVWSNRDRDVKIGSIVKLQHT